MNVESPLAPDHRVSEAGSATNSRSSPSGNSLALLGISVALCLAIGFIYVQTIKFDFVNFDDNVYIFENARLQQGLTRSNVIWAFTNTDTSNWHPLTWISHLIDYECYQLRWPGGHHLTSVLIHAATAVLLLLALCRLTGNLLPSAFAAAIFAVHPLRVESVAWIAERKDVLSGFFFALTLLAYAGYAHRPSVLRYLTVMLAFVCGLMCKSMLVTVPFVLLLLDYWPLGRLVPKNRRPAGAPALGWLLLEKAPLLILSGAAAAITVVAQEKAIKGLNVIPLELREANAANSYVEYLRQLFWPSGLTVWYRHPLHNLLWWQIVGAHLVILGLTVGAFALRRRRPYLLVGWLWYLGMLLPVIGLVQVGGQARADRYTYLPQIGLVIALSWWFADVAARWRAPRFAVAVTSLTLIAVLCWCAQRQTRYWRDSMSLYTRAVEYASGHSLAYEGLGAALEKSGRIEEAAEQYRKAAESNPRLPVNFIRWGNALAALGKYQQALGCFERALELNPNDLCSLYDAGSACFDLGRYEESIGYLHRCLTLDPSSAVAKSVLGGALYYCGRTDEADAVLRELVDANRANADAFDFLGLVRSRQGRFEEAVECHRRAVGIAPDRPSYRRHLGIALYHSNDPKEAMVQLREAVRLAPNQVDVLKSAAWVAATSQESSVRSSTDAVAWAERAAALCKNSDPVVLDCLAAAYAEAGRYEEAETIAQKALQLNESKETEAKIRAHLGCYRTRKPLVEPPSSLPLSRE